MRCVLAKVSSGEDEFHSKQLSVVRDTGVWNRISQWKHLRSNLMARSDNWKMCSHASERDGPILVSLESTSLLQMSIAMKRRKHWLIITSSQLIAQWDVCKGRHN